MPAEGMQWLPRSELLTYEEIARVARVCVERFGFESVRITGGEPLVRAHVTRFVEMLAPLGVDIAMTTNGVKLPELAHDWPGNIRELENAIHFALIVCCDGVIEAADLNLRSRTSAALAEAPTAEPAESALFAGLAREIGKFMHNPPDNLFRQIEKLLVGIALRECGGNQVHTARLLGISRNTLRTLLRRDGLN